MSCSSQAPWQGGGQEDCSGEHGSGRARQQLSPGPLKLFLQELSNFFLIVLRHLL